MMRAATPSKACITSLRAHPGRISARSVRAHYNVTFVYPDGDEVDVECPPDRYVLDVAEVRPRILAYPASTPRLWRNHLHRCLQNILIHLGRAVFFVRRSSTEIPEVHDVDRDVVHLRSSTCRAQRAFDRHVIAFVRCRSMSGGLRLPVSPSCPDYRVIS